MTVSSTPLESKSFRIFNPTSKKAFWLTAKEDGAMVVDEVNPDQTYCPDLLQDPVYTPSPAIFTTGVPTITTFQFDGQLGVGSTVSLNSGSGVVSTISLSGSMMTFQYTASTGDVLKFTVKSSDGSKTARRLFTPATVTLGPSYIPDSLTKTVFTHGWAVSATATFDRPIASLNVEIVDDSGVRPEPSQSPSLDRQLTSRTLSFNPGRASSDSHR